jgi:hypothetical protein
MGCFEGALAGFLRQDRLLKPSIARFLAKIKGFAVETPDLSAYR